MWQILLPTVSWSQTFNPQTWPSSHCQLWAEGQRPFQSLIVYYIDFHLLLFQCLFKHFFKKGKIEKKQYSVMSLMFILRGFWMCVQSFASSPRICSLKPFSWRISDELLVPGSEKHRWARGAPPKTNKLQYLSNTPDPHRVLSTLTVVLILKAVNPAWLLTLTTVTCHHLERYHKHCTHYTAILLYIHIWTYKLY